MENVNVYNTMTVKELASTSQRDVDTIFECLFYIETSSPVTRENSILDFSVIQQVCKKLGVRPTIIARPSIDKKIEGKNVMSQVT